MIKHYRVNVQIATQFQWKSNYKFYIAFSSNKHEYKKKLQSYNTQSLQVNAENQYL